MDGIMLKNVFTTAMEMINTESVTTSVNPRNHDEAPNNAVETRFVWMPGISPVNTPARIPSPVAISISTTFIFRSSFSFIFYLFNHHFNSLYYFLQDY